MKFFKFVRTHFFLGPFRIVVQRKTWLWSQRHLGLNPNPVIYSQRNAQFRINSTTPKYTHEQTRYAPFQAELLPVKFDIWNFSTMNHLNPSF